VRPVGPNNPSLSASGISQGDGALYISTAMACWTAHASIGRPFPNVVDTVLPVTLARSRGAIMSEFAAALASGRYLEARVSESACSTL
jgi:hypothetical protein